MRARTFGWLTSWVCLTACGADVSWGADGATDAAILRATYYEDVRPILAAHCVGCHVDGGIAPIALDSFERVAPLAARIAAVTRQHVMPPFLVDDGGQCNHYRDPRTLSETEIAVLTAFDAAGAPEGDRATPPPSPIPLPTLNGDVRPIDTGADYVPAGGRADDYRCFVVEAPATEDPYFVSGFDVQPGNPRIAHHVIVFHPASEEEAAAARALDDADPGPGYTCFGAAGVRAAAVAAWAPGGGATHFPDGTAVQLRGGRSLIVQMHYNLLGGNGLPDRTRVDLEIRTGGVTAGRFLPMADLALTLAPHLESTSWSTTLRVADYTPITASFRVRGVFPHMHTLGRSLRIDVEHADGTSSCLTDVPRWDFNWQMLYFYEDEGLLVQPTDALTIRCTYDTRTRDGTTTWGEGTQDEMCVAGLFVTL